MNFESPKADKKKPHHKNESALNRVVGVPRDAEKDIQKNLREHSVSVEMYVNKEFTPEMREAIGQINQLLKRFLFTYGLQEFVDIVPENIEFVDYEKDQLVADTKESIAGHYRPEENKIALFGDWKRGNYRNFVSVLIHEMIHMQSFQSFEVIPDESSWRHWWARYEDDSGEMVVRDLRTRRVGTSITKRDGSLALDWLNEGITEELTKRFMREHERNIDILKASRRPTVLYEKYKQSNIKVFTLGKNDGHTYRKERDKLNQLVDTIFKYGGQGYKSRDEVFKLFTRAAMNGRLLPLARAIEKAEGRGMFRKLAELDVQDL